MTAVVQSPPRPSRAAIRAHLLLAAAENALIGRLPFEGGWFTKREIEARIQDRERRAQRVLVELALLSAGSLVLASLLVLATYALAY
jgi:hypothetical protein